MMQIIISIAMGSGVVPTLNVTGLLITCCGLKVVLYVLILLYSLGKHTLKVGSRPMDHSWSLHEG